MTCSAVRGWSLVGAVAQEQQQEEDSALSKGCAEDGWELGNDPAARKQDPGQEDAELQP